MMTDAPDGASGDRMTRAYAACQKVVEDAQGTMQGIIAEGLAGGIECLRGDNGMLDADHIRTFFEGSHAAELSDLADELAAADADELEADLLEAVEGTDDIEYSLVAVIGVAEPLGGYDSTGFAVMTSGCMTTWAIRRGDEYLKFQTGDDCDPYSLFGGGSIADDPQLREARLALARELGGLGPGIWIEGEEELADELRDLSMSGGWHWPDCLYVVLEHADLAEIIEENVATFADSTGLTEADARVRLESLFETAEPKDDVERDVLWETYTSLRN